MARSIESQCAVFEKHVSSPKRWDGLIVTPEHPPVLRTVQKIASHLLEYSAAISYLASSS